MKRNIWYSSIIHFATDIDDTRGLIDWVAARRTFEQPTCFHVTGLELARFRHRPLPSGEHYMLPSSRYSAELSGPRAQL